MLFRDLFMAGAGVYAGPQTGALTSFFAPIIPRKMGLTGADAYTVVRTDAITISYIPNTYSQTTIAGHAAAVGRAEGRTTCPTVRRAQPALWLHEG